jgi:hypothetical protein
LPLPAEVMHVAPADDRPGDGLVTAGLDCGAADVLLGLAFATGLALRAKTVAAAMADAAATAARMIRDDLVISGVPSPWICP